jgi:hypothetical protein
MPEKRNRTDRQPFPADSLKFANKIVTQNGAIVLLLVNVHMELKAGNVGMLEAVLPLLIDGAKSVYENAIQMEPFIERETVTKVPLWGKQSRLIVKEYPALITRMALLQDVVKSQRMTDFLREIAGMFKLTARIQLQLLKISYPDPQPGAKDERPYYVVSVPEIQRHSEQINK